MCNVKTRIPPTPAQIVARRQYTAASQNRRTRQLRAKRIGRLMSELFFLGGIDDPPVPTGHEGVDDGR